MKIPQKMTDDQIAKMSPDELRQRSCECMIARKECNTYTQGSRRDEFFGSSKEGGAGYSDCSSSVYHSKRRAANLKIGGNTSEQLKQAESRGLVVEWNKDGKKRYPDESKMLHGDDIYFAGNSNHYRNVGHVEEYVGKGVLYGHGSGKGPKKHELKAYCDSRSKNAKWLAVVRQIQGESSMDDTPDGTAGDGQNPYVAPKAGSIQKKNSVGESVRWIQWELRDSGYSCILMNARPAELEIDGEFGPITKEAVVQFQKRYGLPQDGVVNDVVRKSMVEHTGAVSVDPPTEPPAVGTTGRIIDISYCDTVNWVKLSQIEGKGKIVFSILRAMGKGYKIDVNFLSHLKGCKKIGMRYGCYIYSYAKNAAEGEKEAVELHKIIESSGAKPEAIFFDAEEGKNTEKAALAFFNKIKLLFGDIYVGFYSMDSRCCNWKNTVAKFDGVWSARWNTPDIKPNYKTYHMWQHGMEKIAGCSPKIDVSRFRDGVTLESMLATRKKPT